MYQVLSNKDIIKAYCVICGRLKFVRTELLDRIRFKSATWVQLISGCLYVCCTELSVSPCDTPVCSVGSSTTHLGTTFYQC